MKRFFVSAGVATLLMLTVFVGTQVASGAPGWGIGSKQYRKPAVVGFDAGEATPAFIRVRSGATGTPEALETAIASYTPRDGSNLKVTLIGALHVAEADYFKALNKNFESYDAVLYELVAPQDTRPTPESVPSNDPLSMFQRLLPELLGISFQLNEIDYQAENLVHADMSADQLFAAGKARGETTMSIVLGVLSDAMRKAKQDESKASPNGPDALTLLTNTVVLKRTLATGLADPNGLEGLRTLAPYIIEMRNDAALKVLEREIAEGNTNIAIFYGAGHLKDFEHKLISRFGLKQQSLEWLPAWDLTHAGTSKTPPIAQLVRMLSN